MFVRKGEVRDHRQLFGVADVCGRARLNRGYTQALLTGEMLLFPVSQLWSVRPVDCSAGAAQVPHRGERRRESQ